MKQRARLLLLLLNPFSLSYSLYRYIYISRIYHLFFFFFSILLHWPRHGRNKGSKARKQTTAGRRELDYYYTVNIPKMFLSWWLVADHMECEAILEVKVWVVAFVPASWEYYYIYQDTCHVLGNQIYLINFLTGHCPVEIHRLLVKDPTHISIHIPCSALWHASATEGKCGA